MHQKVKFLLDGEVITIDASMSKTVSALRDEQKQVVAPPGFQVAIIEMDPKVSSMIKKMNYRPGQGLGKNEQGSPELQDFKGQGHSKGMGYKKTGLSKVARRRFFSMNNILKNVKPLKDSFVKRKESFILARRNLSRWLE